MQTWIFYIKKFAIFIAIFKFFIKMKFSLVLKIAKSVVSGIAVARYYVPIIVNRVNYLSYNDQSFLDSISYALTITQSIMVG